MRMKTRIKRNKMFFITMSLLSLGVAIYYDSSFAMLMSLIFSSTGLIIDEIFKSEIRIKRLIDFYLDKEEEI